MARAQFIFCVHNHQPVGNFEHLFEEAYQKAYRPFLEVLERHPRVKCALHTTGVLLDWLAARHPEYLDRLAVLVRRGQVEPLTGGHYEPILTAIPEADRIGQIRKLTATLERLTGVTPTTLWLAERVWEPHLPRSLRAAGVEALVVDDYHFGLAGLAPGQLTGYYLTEEQGDVVAVFPGSERLRYTIPFEPPERTLEWLRRAVTEGEPEEGPDAVVYADDGEKFGVWPGTHALVYGEGWLERFCQALEAARDWLEVVTFAEYRARAAPRGRVYLPTASYMEMGEWALPAGAMRRYERLVAEARTRPDWEEVRPFLRGGYWRNFLAKYPEANALHKKMLRVSRKVEAAARHDAARGAEARDLLYRAQCNDPYWHGIFGGLYLPHLRSAAYRNLVRAEALADTVLAACRPGPLRAYPWGGEVRGLCAVEAADLDGDGMAEVAIESPAAALLLAPAAGGALAEFDVRPAAFNLLDTLARRVEGYHSRLGPAAASWGGRLAAAQQSPGPHGSAPEASPPGEGRPAPPAEDPAGRPASPEASAGEAGDRPVAAKSIHELVQVKEPGLERLLVEDRHRRLAFLDHFLPREADLDRFARGACEERGRFCGARYEWILLEPPPVAEGEIPSEPEPEPPRVRMTRRAAVRSDDGGAPVPVVVTKTFRHDGDRAAVTVAYQVQNDGRTRLETTFGVELTLNLLASRAPDRYYRIPGIELGPGERQLASRGATPGVTAVELVDEWLPLTVRLAWDEPAELWRFPVETVSLSEGGFERIFQGSALLLRWPLALGPGGRFRVRLELSAS